MWVKSATNKSLKITTFLECIENIVIWSCPMIFIKIQKTLVQIVTKNLLSSSMESIIFPDLFLKECFKRHMQYNFQLPGNRKKSRTCMLFQIFTVSLERRQTWGYQKCVSRRDIIQGKHYLFAVGHLDREFPSAERCLFKRISFQWFLIDPKCFAANK